MVSAKTALIFVRISETRQNASDQREHSNGNQWKKPPELWIKLLQNNHGDNDDPETNSLKPNEVPPSKSQTDIFQ
jgi:hypothetical protein